MTKNEMLTKIKDLLKERKMSHLDEINVNCNKSTLQNAIDCLECTDELLEKYLIVVSLKYPNIGKVVSENGDFKIHSHNRLYIYNTARMILA